MEPVVYYTSNKITNEVIAKVEEIENRKIEIITNLGELVEYLDKDEEAEVVLTNLGYFANVYNNVINID